MFFSDDSGEDDRGWSGGADDRRKADLNLDRRSGLNRRWSGLINVVVDGRQMQADVASAECGILNKPEISSGLLRFRILFVICTRDGKRTCEMIVREAQGSLQISIKANHDRQ